MEKEWLPSIVTISDDNTKGGEISNCHIIFGDSEIAIIDTGITDQTESLIKDTFYTYDRKLSELTHVIMTHSHPDNIGALSFLLNNTPCKFFAHENSLSIYKDPKKNVLGKQFPLDRMGKMSLALRTPIFSGYRDVREPDYLLRDGDNIPFDDGKLLVRHIGGHSADSILIYDLKRKAAFIGDEGNIYTNDFDSFFFDATGNAIARKNFLKLWSNINAKYFFPSHGYPISRTDSLSYAQNLLIDQERIENELKDLLLELGEAKAYLIGVELTEFLSFEWETPYKELKVEQTTAQILLNLLEKRGFAQYNEKTERWKPIEL